MPLRLYLPLGVALLSGCAPPTVVKQEIPVSSNPIGATVLVDGTPMGTTPKRIALERNQNYMLTLVKEGYEQENVPITRRYQDASLGARDGWWLLGADDDTGQAQMVQITEEPPYTILTTLERTFYADQRARTP